MSEVNFDKLSKELAGRSGISSFAILITILAILVTFVIWGANTELDGVVRGEGRLVSAAENQLVQAAEGGVIIRRFVTENSVVSEGDVLFELDPVDATSELNRVRQRMNTLRIRELRLRAEISGIELVIPADLEAVSGEVAITERNLFTARKLELNGSLSILREQLNQRQQSLRSAEREEVTAARTAAFLTEEIAIVEPLVRENIAPATRLLELQRELETAEGRVSAAQFAQEQARSGIQELETQLVNTHASFNLRATSELNGVVGEIAELEQSMPRLQERVSRTMIRAPMDGIVNQINYRTVGGYVPAGNVMVEIVPTGEDLIVEAKIPAKDISRINPDDTVKIRLAAYDAQRYGFLDGRVLRISPDAQQSDNPAIGSHYLIDVAIESEIINEQTDEAVTLLPGMTATVEVLHGKRTVLEYLWRPLLRIQDTALRD